MALNYIPVHNKAADAIACKINMLIAGMIIVVSMVTVGLTHTPWDIVITLMIICLMVEASKVMMTKRDNHTQTPKMYRGNTTNTQKIQIMELKQLSATGWGAGKTTGSESMEEVD